MISDTKKRVVYTDRIIWFLGVCCLFFVIMMKYRPISNTESIFVRSHEKSYFVNEKTRIFDFEGADTSINLPNIVKKTRINTTYKLDNLYDFERIGDIGNDAQIPDLKEINNKISEQYIEIVEMENIFFDNDGIFYIDEHLYSTDCECHYRYCEEKNKYGPDKLQGYSYVEYDHVLAITHEYSFYYAHFLIDFLPSFLMVPKMVLDRAFIMVSHPQKFVISGFEALGIPTSKIISLGDKEFVFAKHYYTVLPILCTEFNAYLLLNLRTTIANKYNLDRSPPFRYVLYARVNGYRNFTNFPDVMKGLVKNLPQVNWEYLKADGHLEEQAKTYNEVKVFISMHGASFANTLFMQKDTVVGEIQVDRWVNNYLWVSAFTQKHHLLMRNKSVQWRGETENYISVEIVTKMARRALEILKIV